MKINPVYSAPSFGQKDNKKQTLMFPSAIVGAIGGAGYAHQSKIKLDKDSYEKTIEIIDEKLDKSPDLEKRFSTLKNKILKIKEYNAAQLTKLGISPETTEISIDDLLKNYVGNESKDLKGLKTDIEYITNRKNYLLSLSKRTAEENGNRGSGNRGSGCGRRTFDLFSLRP